jgi:hypothetical protein
VLTDIFQEDNFEKLLVANWTRFLDSSKLLAYVLRNVQENANSLAIINGQNTKAKGVKATISRFYLDIDRFTIWLEFTVPLGINRTAEGTMELALDFRGNLTHINTVGNILMP